MLGLGFEEGKGTERTLGLGFEEGNGNENG
jgi:hypothetical protein